MRDALGTPQSILLLGGTSEIGLATARRLCAGRPARVVLAGRSGMDGPATVLREDGARVETITFDATNVDEHEKVLDEVFDAGDIDVVILAFGVLGDQERAMRDNVNAAEIAQVNYVGAMSAAIVCARRLKQQGHGSLVVLSSVAAERGRKSNFVYGSTKAGLDTFTQGLGDSLHGSGVHVMLVRPGFVRTKMTAGMKEAPLATTAGAVADAVAKGLRRRSAIVWVPGALRWVMSGLRHLPRPVFRRLPL